MKTRKAKKRGSITICLLAVLGLTMALVGLMLVQQKRAIDRSEHVLLIDKSTHAIEACIALAHKKIDDGETEFELSGELGRVGYELKCMAKDGLAHFDIKTNLPDKMTGNCVADYRFDKASEWKRVSYASDFKKIVN